MFVGILIALLAVAMIGSLWVAGSIASMPEGGYELKRGASEERDAAENDRWPSTP